MYKWHNNKARTCVFQLLHGVRVVVVVAIKAVVVVAATVVVVVIAVCVVVVVIRVGRRERGLAEPRGARRPDGGAGGDHVLRRGAQHAATTCAATTLQGRPVLVRPKGTAHVSTLSSQITFLTREITLISFIHSLGETA